MPFGIIGRTGQGMRHVVGFGDRSPARGTFGANLGRAIVTDGDLLLQRDAALFPNYFEQTCSVSDDLRSVTHFCCNYTIRYFQCIA